MKLYRTRPVTVEALQWTGDNRAEWFSFWGAEDTGKPIGWTLNSWAFREGSDLRVLEEDAFLARFEPLL
jgi:hypothetical protein